MRSLLIASVLVACQGNVQTPAIEIVREPSNRASLDPFTVAETKPEPKSRPAKPVAPPAAIGFCLRSRMCGYEGLCSSTESGLCIAESNEDCAPSDACLGGRCTARNGVCIASTDEECRGSWACKGWGRCFHDGHEACAAKLAADCRASTRCQREGECTLAGEECVK